ncbi:HET-domain-containing protein [Xylaria bambusicola]|uniref:HET-domain-containing protein n=1 Tax=Xylaria bambusicola TaxID=326684 RepID=UPI0020082F82|nr:HET-domain-containing protein [Xylaria bambusicola]KAI0505487.1 HET-domain-containing protein [Xylaria bambusicola]
MEVLEAGLCQFCSQLFPLRETLNTTRAHLANVADLVMSAESCRLCCVIRDNWSLELPVPDQANSEAPIDTAASAREIWKVPETSIPTKISTMKTWLSDCLSNHHSCRPSANYLPKRLIEAGPSGHSPLRLVRSTHLSAGTRYIAVSHCWGPTLPIRTTKANEAIYTREIPFPLLPQTFRDAISIAEALGIRYLWIDALCIVQDDPLEWEVEAASMKDVYSGAILTIAASEATQSTEGCFKNQSSAPRPSHDSPETYEEEELLAFFTTPPCSTGRLSDMVRIQAGDVREAAQQNILSTRGWVLQEQLLSRRMISCMHQSLYWQCLSTYETEPGAIFQVRREDAWRIWMTNYSGRKFSFVRDRLCALAGIVQHYQEMAGGLPVLGLWDFSITRDLLWVRTGTCHDMGQSVKNLNIPSWSWLSCPAEITFDLWKLTIRSKSVREAIRDHTSLIDWEVSWRGTPFTSRPTRDVLLKVATDTGEANPPFFLVMEESAAEDGKPLPLRCAAQFDSADINPPYRYKCLLLRSRTHLDSQFIHETFLILELVSHIQQPLYKRVGIGNFRGKVPAFNWTELACIDLL